MHGYGIPTNNQKNAINSLEIFLFFLYFFVYIYFSIIFILADKLFILKILYETLVFI